MSALSIGYAFAHCSFLTMLSHRARYLIGVVNYIVYVAVQWYLWEAVFYQQQIVAQWSLPEMQTYTSVNWIIRSIYFSNSDSVLAGRINSGQIVSELLRPTSLLVQFYGQALGEMLFRGIFMGLPVALLVYIIFGIQPPASPLCAVGFVISTFLAFQIFFAVNFLTGLAAIFTEKLQGFLWAKFILLQFLAGQMLPLEFFGSPFREILDFLPFKGIAYTPMSIYLGRWDVAKMEKELLFQTLWSVGLLLACHWAWNGVRRRLSSHGG